MPRKGNGYKPTEVVAEAMTQVGGTVETFFANARKFGKTRINATREAENFKNFRTNPDAFPHYTVPPTVVAFADWLLIADPAVVKRKYQFNARP